MDPSLKEEFPKIDLTLAQSSELIICQELQNLDFSEEFTLTQDSFMDYDKIIINNPNSTVNPTTGSTNINSRLIMNELYAHMALTNRFFV